MELKPAGWQKKRLDDLANIRSGGTPSTNVPKFWDGAIPWCTPTDITRLNGGKYLAETSRTISQEGLASSSAEVIPENSVVMTSRATIGECAINTVPVTTNQGFKNFIPFDSTDIGFLYYLLQMQKQGFIRLCAGSTFLEIGKTQLASYEVCVPAQKEDQSAIAAALGDVDALLSALDALIAKQRDLKTAAMQQLLTGKTRLPGFGGEWGVKRLGELASVDEDNLGATTSPDYAFKYVSLEDVDAGTLRGYSEQVFASSPSRARRKLRAGDVLVSTVRPNLKSHLLFDKNENDWICSTGFSVLRCIKGLAHPGFVFQHLFGNVINAQVNALLAGSNYPAINGGDVRRLEIETPRIEEQAAIAEVLGDMDAQLAALEQQREKTALLKQGMMQELLTGRTRLVQPAMQGDSNVVELPAVAAKPQAHNWAINEAVVVSMLVKKFGNEQYPLGRKRCTKLAYLMHRHVEHVAEGYRKKAAGPYNPDVKYRGPEGIAQKNGYIRQHKSGSYSGFIAAEKIGEAENYFLNWYGQDVLSWLEQFRKKTNDELELLATVDMAVEDLRLLGAVATLEGVKFVIANHSEWQAKLEREIFSDSNIRRAIQRVGELFAE